MRPVFSPEELLDKHAPSPSVIPSLFSCLQDYVMYCCLVTPSEVNAKGGACLESLYHLRTMVPVKSTLAKLNPTKAGVEVG
jgi:hypothetical protein